MTEFCSLTRLSLNSTSGVDVDGWEGLVGIKWQVLRISECPGMTVEIFKRVLKESKNTLQAVVIGSNHWVNDKALLGMQECLRLDFVDLSNCNKVTSLGLDVFGKKVGVKWRYVNVGGLKVSSESLKRLEGNVGRQVVRYGKE